MITVAPGATFEAWAQFATGATVGVRIRDGAGADFLARTTTGVTEDIAGSGIFRKSNFTAPTTAGQYQLVWDDGTLYAAEELLVTYSAAAAAAASNEYVTVAELKATLSMTGETFADDDITIAVTTASRSIDDHCNRRFWADSDALQVAYYTPFDSSVISIDDLITLTSVKTDPGADGTFEETWTLTTDFLLAPMNRKLIDATNREPWTQIQRRVGGNYSFSTSYERTVEVTGKFGWPVVPAQVKAAARILAARYLKRARETPYGVIGVGLDGAAVRISQSDPDITRMLSRLVRGTTGIAGLS